METLTAKPANKIAKEEVVMDELDKPYDLDLGD